MYCVSDRRKSYKGIANSKKNALNCSEAPLDPRYIGDKAHYDPALQVNVWGQRSFQKVKWCISMSRCRLSYWHMLERVKILGRYIMRYFLKGWETLLELEILTAVVYDFIDCTHVCITTKQKILPF